LPILNQKLSGPRHRAGLVATAGSGANQVVSVTFLSFWLKRRRSCAPLYHAVRIVRWGHRARGSTWTTRIAASSSRTACGVRRHPGLPHRHHRSRMSCASACKRRSAPSGPRRHRTIQDRTRTSWDTTSTASNRPGRRLRQRPRTTRRLHRPPATPPGPPDQSPTGRNPLGRNPLGRSPLDQSPLDQSPLGRSSLDQSPPARPIQPSGPSARPGPPSPAGPATPPRPAGLATPPGPGPLPDRQP